MRITIAMRYTCAAVALACTLFAQGASASVIISGTRVVYPSDARDVNIKLINSGQSPAVVQVWLDNGNPQARPEYEKVPFILTPPVTRIDPGSTQTVRLVYTGNGQRSDQETLYWLNMLEIPPRPVEGANYLQFALRTRIKVFYRPAELRSGSSDAVRSLEWNLDQASGHVVAVANNPSAYYLSLSQVRLVAHDGLEFGKPQNITVAPQASLSISFDTADAALVAPIAVRYQLIDDFGALIEGEKAFKVVSP